MDSAPLPIDLGAFARWLGYLGAFSLIGAAVFRDIVRRAAHTDLPTSMPAALRARTAGIATFGALFLLIGAALRLLAQVRAFLEPGEPMTADVFRAMARSGWGHGWRWQVAAAALALVTALWSRRGTGGQAIASALAALGIIAAAPLTGHAGEFPWNPQLGLTLDALHLAAAGAWLGTLGIILLVAYPATSALDADARGPALAAIVDRFSPVALAGAGTASACGTLMAFAYVGSIQALWTTDYGRVLLAKLACLLLVAAAGAYNWRRLKPALATGNSASLRRAATLELLLGTILLAVTAVLVSVAAPGL